MKTIKMKGKTVEEAVESALAVLGAKKEQVSVSVLKEGKGGVLGVFGGEAAEVEVTVKGGLSEEAQTRLQDLLDKMGLMTIVSAKEAGEDIVYAEIKGEDLGRIIGKEGATLEALQLLLGATMSKSAKRRVRIIVDAAGYRERRAKKVGRIALEAVQKAQETGEEAVLPPMSAADRRIVHLFIKEKQGMVSFSRGEREGRRVVVVPEEKAKELIEEGEKEELSAEEGKKKSGEKER